MSMVYAHTTRKTDLLYKIFHLNHVFMTPMTPMDISFSDRAHMSKRCTQINTHRLLETAPVKIARANHVNLSLIARAATST